MSRERATWPAWLEALRPDEASRARMREAIPARAASILEARRLASWHEVAAGWAGMLVPIAAVLLLFFGGLAYQAGPGAVAAPRATPVTLEALLDEGDPDAELGVLAASVEPSADWALATVIRGWNGVPAGEDPPRAGR